MKYIPADKLLAEIEKLNSLVPYKNNDRHDDGLHDAYKAVKNVIASLQQEQPISQPQPSLPSNLDEAAEKDAIRTYAMPEDGNIDKVFKVQEARTFHEIGFKAGAEWMAGQGLNAKKEVEL